MFVWPENRRFGQTRFRRWACEYWAIANPLHLAYTRATAIANESSVSLDVKNTSTSWRFRGPECEKASRALPSVAERHQE